ncbi:hypothetical protein FACS189452_07300 [Bacteroidia bacterium]|nr:hypothetical protein FACS189452_07300 [Bacteroidia bacterium]
MANNKHIKKDNRVSRVGGWAMVFIISCSLCISSCSTVFYQPDEGAFDTRMSVDLNVSVSLLEMKMVGDATSIAESNDGKDIRITVELYPTTEWGEITGERAARIVATQPFKSSTDFYQLKETVLLEPVRYSLIVWADFVEQGTTIDKYYNTADLREVSIINTLEKGFNPQKDAHAGKEILNISAYKSKPSVPAQKVNVPLLRPFARYQLWTDDLRRYISQNPGEALPLTVKTDYDISYIPLQYDIFAAKVDRRTQSLSFLRSTDNNTAVPNSENDLMLTEDYVLLENNFEISLATFTIYRPDNTVVGTVDLEAIGKTIELRRNELTIVSGRYLTSSPSAIRPPTTPDNPGGGTGINDRFKDEVVKILPD